jgi:HK97 family phage portal protein
MGILDLFRRKQVTDDQKYLQSSVGVVSLSSMGMMPPFSMVRSVDAYRSWVYAAATINAQAVAAVPLRMYVRSDVAKSSKMWATRPVPRKRKAFLLGDSERKPSVSAMKTAQLAGDFEELVEAHPVLELLRKANPYEDGFGLAVSRILFLELTGNAYLHVVTDASLGVPSAIYTVPAQHVTVQPGRERLIDFYLYGTNSQQMRRFELDEIIHFKRPNPMSLYYGCGKVEAAYGAIQLNAATHEMDLGYAQNMARPDYAAIVKGGASAESMRRFEESMRMLHQGGRKAGRMVAISGDITLQPLSFPAKDTAGRDDIVEEIAAVFGVPVTMLKANDPNLASSQVGMQQWREGTIAPICRLDEETLNTRLLPLFGIEEDAYLAYDDAVPSNREMDARERQAAVAGGWRTPNEARLEEGYDELPDPEANKLHVGGLPLGGAAAQSPFGGLQLALQGLQQQAATRTEIEPAEPVKSLPPAEDDRITFEVGTTEKAEGDDCVRDKVRTLIREGYDREQAVAIAYSMCGEKALDDVDLQPSEEMAALASRGLELRAEYGRGGTEVGVARARDIGNRENLSPETVNRMHSFFSRHRVDLDATGARPGEDGYPTAGAIAWMLWGGDPSDPDGAGAGWAARKVEELRGAAEKAYADEREAVVRAAEKRVAEYKALEMVHGEGADAISELQRQIAAMNERQAAMSDVMKALGEAFDG